MAQKLFYITIALGLSNRWVCILIMFAFAGSVLLITSGLAAVMCLLLPRLFKFKLLSQFLLLPPPLEKLDGIGHHSLNLGFPM